jgi:DNA uptake protein ComE-like DNA-binding protein
MFENQILFQQEGKLKMMRPSMVRSVVLLPILLFTLSMCACSSGSENARPANNMTATPASNVSANTPSATTNQGSSAAVKPKLNLNTASANDFLTGIPGMGNKMVHEFEEYRPYRSIQQFRKEIGKYVSPEQVAEYEKYVFVPINANEADAATLQQIPGLDANEAQSLITARPFASNDAFLSKLAGSISEAELAVAKTYLNNK